VCVYQPGQVSEDHQPESPEHRAFKERIVAVADREGFATAMEARSGDGARVTDVIVRGDQAGIGWEVQLSPISAEHVQRRRGLALRDSLTPSWICTSPSSQVVDRVPHGVVHEYTARHIENLLDLRIRSGYRRIELRRCTGSDRSTPWHRGRRCGNWHGRPANVDPDGQPTFDDLVRKTAAGQIVAVRWPRPTRLRREFWLWAPRQDAEQFWDVELDAAPAFEAIPAQREAPHVGFERTHNLAPLTPAEDPDSRDQARVTQFGRLPIVVHGTSAAGWSQGLAPHQRCPCGNAAPPRADGRRRSCAACT
jgi:hypothetical protein